MSFSAMSLITVILIFVAAIGLVLSYAMINDRQAQIRSLMNELGRLEEDNNLIRAQLSQAYDIREIERIAIQRLMMGPPQPHQVVHIYVPPVSRIVPGEADEYTED